jgi:hypothetical protein
MLRPVRSLLRLFRLRHRRRAACRKEAGFLCRRCGIIGDLLHLKWWHKLIPRCRRYYCAGCGRTFLRIRFTAGD